MNLLTRNRDIAHWDAEDVQAWEAGNKTVAKRNLIWSIVAEHVGFSIWSIWSVMVLFMPQDVYGIDAAGKFYLVAVPTLVGAVHAHPVHHRARPLRRTQLDHRSARCCCSIPALLTLYFMQPAGTSYTDVPGRRGARRLRRRQLRVVDDEHQRLLPAAAQGLGAGPQRGRRQHRRARDPAGRPARHRDRSATPYPSVVCAIYLVAHRASPPLGAALFMDNLRPPEVEPARRWARR